MSIFQESDRSRTSTSGSSTPPPSRWWSMKGATTSRTQRCRESSSLMKSSAGKNFKLAIWLVETSSGWRALTNEPASQSVKTRPSGGGGFTSWVSVSDSHPTFKYHRTPSRLGLTSLCQYFQPLLWEEELWKQERNSFRSRGLWQVIIINHDKKQRHWAKSYIGVGALPILFPVWFSPSQWYFVVN